VVQDYDQLLACLKGRKSVPQLVRVGLGGFASEYYLPRLLALMREAGANFEVQATVARGEERILRTARGEFQLAVVTHDPPLVDRIVTDACGPRVRLVVEPLAEQPMCVVSKRSTAEAHELDAISPDQPVPLSKLRDWDLVGLDVRSGIRRQLERQFPSSSDLQFVAEGGGWPAARECARLGLGVAIVPTATLSLTDRRDFIIRRAPERFMVADYLIYRDQKLSSAVVTVKELLQQAATEHRQLVNQAWKQLV
jgi:DNA-binding transcriptional LysR family regulator